MTQDEIIEIATKVWGECDWHESALCHLEAFAKLVAQHEREACAKICDELQDVPATEPRHCAEDIRARNK
jgi:hypothetical protein